jgi:GDP-L-fucose synthase
MPTNLYGLGDNYHPTNSHVLPAMIRKFYHAKRSGKKSVTCWGSGTPMREFLHVDDVGNASIFALEKWTPNSADAPHDYKGNPLYYLNVGTSIDLTIKELAETVAKAMRFRGQILWDGSKPDGTPKKQHDIFRMIYLNWTPSIDLLNGLRQTILDYSLQFEASL